MAKPEFPQYHQTEPAASFSVNLVNNSLMQQRWTDIEAALRKAFADSQYNDAGYDVNNPVEYTRKGVNGELGPNMGHALATKKDNSIIGGIFCIPTTSADSKEADVGWVFLMPDIALRDRLPVMDALVDTLV